MSASGVPSGRLATKRTICCPDLVADQVAALHPPRPHHRLERLGPRQQVQGHAVAHQGGQGLLPFLELRQVVLPQGEDDARRRRARTRRRRRARGSTRTPLQCFRSAVLDQIGELGEELGQLGSGRGGRTRLPRRG